MGVTFMMVLAWVSTEVWLASVVVLSRLSWVAAGRTLLKPWVGAQTSVLAEFGARI